MHEVLTIRPTQGPNPEFDQRKYIEAVKNGDEYDVPHTIEIPEGTIIRHPRAHHLARPGYLNASPVAVPCCEQTQRKLKHHIDVQREAGFRLLSAAVSALPTDQKAAQQILKLAETYSIIPATKDEVEKLKQRLLQRVKPNEKK